MELENIVMEFLKLDPSEIASSRALDEFLNKNEYIKYKDENTFELAMKLIYNEYR